MSRTITIAGVDRTKDIKLDEFSIEQNLTYREDNCSFVVKNGSKPTTGQEIIIENILCGSFQTTRFFAGIIDKADDDPRAPGVTFYKCQARDYTFMLNRRLVVEVYENWTADDIVRDIITKYCAGFTYVNVMTGSPIIETTGAEFNYKHPSECLKWLCDYTGWQWYVDYYKDVHFFDPSATGDPAPVTINTSANFRDFKRDLDIEGICNRIYVRGGTMLSDYVTYEYKADGVQRVWILPYKPHEVTISVGGGAVITPGIENIDDETTKTWMMNYQEKIIRLATGQADIAAGTTVAFVFKHDIDVITYQEDIASQTAIASMQGGDGIYEHVIVDDSLTTLNAAKAVADSYLREHADPIVKGSFLSDTDGWAPGQLISIDLPDEGIDNSYLVQKVTITPLDINSCTYKIEYGGRLLGIADFLKSLISAQQKKKLGSTEVIHKIRIFAEDTADVTDALTSTPRTPSWVCGDADAICGFVECYSKYIHIRHTAGTFDFSITDGQNVLWVFPDGAVSTATKPTRTVGAGTTRLYADNLSGNIQINDNNSNAIVTGSLEDFNKLTYYLNLVSCTNITGSLADLQGKITYYLSLASCTKITGSLADLQGKITSSLDLAYCANITGSLADLQGKITSSLNLSNCNNITGVYTPVGAGTPTYTYLSYTGLTADDMDNTLIAYAAGAKNNGTFTATGMTRTTASDAAVAALTGRGWTIGIGGAAQP